VFGSRRCDCGAQLDAAMAAIAAEGRGIVLYLRGHEGRGIGLLSKLRAYQLQDAGADTVDANLDLGLPVDAREYSTGAQMLADLGVDSLRLLTNNPAKMLGLSGYGIKITGRVALPVVPTADNLRYLIAKRDRLGHQLTELPVVEPGTASAAGNGHPANGHSPDEAGNGHVGPAGAAADGGAPASGLDADDDAGGGRAADGGAAVGGAVAHGSFTGRSNDQAPRAEAQ
jgi:3,4-dihydroxy 2-butanone 4-phosphate synthase / GTP cyclohydrolase II